MLYLNAELIINDFICVSYLSLFLAFILLLFLTNLNLLFNIQYVNLIFFYFHTLRDYKYAK